MTFPPFRHSALRAALFGVLALGALSAQAAPATVRSIAAGCPQPRDAQAFEAAFTEATVQRHSAAQLTCAAAMSAAQAARAPQDVDLQMLALDAQINLMEALQLQMETQTYQGGDAFDEIKARWALARQNGLALSGRLAKAAKEVPSIAGLRIAFDLVSVSSVLVPAEQAYKVAASAIEPLKALLARNPRLLDGVGEMMLGRLYFQLPETAGGDLDQAVVHLQKAHEAGRKNIVFLRWLGESLVAVDRMPEAREVLARMLPLEPEPLQFQSFADEWRAAIGLAQRAGDTALAERLTARRQALLKAHPELLTRQSAAVSGHGGADPLTGRHDD